MNIQTIFNKVIENNLYNENSNLMCKSLNIALLFDYITIEEYDFAKQDIKNYLKAFGSLGGMLMHNKLPYAFEDRLVIYKDWENKPVIATKELKK